jgi:uncharacterized protein (DUF169 family)
MHTVKRDFSVFDKFNFDRKPVAIKYLLNKPDAIQKIDKDLSFCEMFKEAQETNPFYATKKNFSCMGPLVLGMQDPDPVFESGQIGAKEKIYQEARANGRIYQYIPKLKRNTARYVAFSPADKLSFEPDVLILTATPNQAEILFRALSYSTGKMLLAKSTPVLMCSWMFVYPFVTGKSNYTVTGLGYGLKTRKLFPEGLLLISIPYDLLSMVIENLKEMDWILKITTLNEKEKHEYSEEIMNEIREEYQNSEV